MLNAWILGWVSEAVVSTPLELWNAPIFHPHPNALAFSEHLLGIGLFVAPVYWLTGDAVLTYNVGSWRVMRSWDWRCACSCEPLPGAPTPGLSPASW